MKKPKSDALPDDSEEYPPFCINEHATFSARHLARMRRHNPEFNPDIIRSVGGYVIFRPKMHVPPMIPERSKQARTKSRIRVDSLDLWGAKYPPGRAHAALSELSAAGDFIQVAAVIKNALETMAEAAYGGNAEATEEFTRVVVESAEWLNAMALRMPKALEPVAGRLNRWPVMKSTHKGLSEPDVVIMQVGLAKLLPVNLGQNPHSKEPKWTHGPTARVAMALVNFLWKLRADEAEFLIIKSADGTKKHRITDLLPLPVMDGEIWWSLARSYFDVSYPDPAAVPELAACCQSKTKIVRRGRHNVGIVAAIRAKFLAQVKWVSAGADWCQT